MKQYLLLDIFNRRELRGRCVPASRVIIGFGLASHWLRNMRGSCEPIRNLWKAKLMQTRIIFNAHLQTAD